MVKLSLCSVMRIRSEVDGRATTCDTRAGNKIAAFLRWSEHGVTKDLILLGKRYT